MEIVMSLINTQIKPFKAMAYKTNEFFEVTDQTLKGKWSVLVSVSYTHLTLPTKA